MCEEKEAHISTDVQRSGRSSPPARTGELLGRGGEQTWRGGLGGGTTWSKFPTPGSRVAGNWGALAPSVRAKPAARPASQHPAHYRSPFRLALHGVGVVVAVVVLLLVDRCHATWTDSNFLNHLTDVLDDDHRPFLPALTWCMIFYDVSTPIEIKEQKQTSSKSAGC